MDRKNLEVTQMPVYSITVNSIDQLVFSGTFEQLFEKKRRVFRGLGHLLLEIDRDMQYRLPGYRRESFCHFQNGQALVLERDKQQALLLDLDKRKRGERKCQFLLSIYCWENETWQGQITWVTGKEKKNFRSCMELLHLLEEGAGADLTTKGEKHVCVSQGMGDRDGSV